jgi:NAD(P)-dependent dehydrogenase (short-subunit alcohol dehydrogenase family)
MVGEFDGNVVMITGASGSLGRAVVQRFYDAGANLALVERRKNAVLDEMAQDVDRDRWLSVTGDVTDRESMQAVVEQINRHYGRIDALAHTVGGYSGGQAVHDVDLDVWQRMMALNATSLYITAGIVANTMLQNGGGGNIVAVLARHALEGQKNHAAYGASKAAAQRIIQSMAQELLEHGIRVNGIIPGTIDTPANRESMPNANFDRWVQPEVVAEAILFLCSSRSSGISGDSLAVYGQS